MDLSMLSGLGDMSGKDLADLAKYKLGDVADRAKIIASRDKAINAPTAEALANRFPEPGKLMAFQKANREAGEKRASDATFQKNWDSLERLVKTNPQVADQMAEQFQQGEAGYRRAIDSIAANFKKDPKFAAAMTQKLAQRPQDAGAEFARYKDAEAEGKLKSYISETVGSSAAPTPAAPAPRGPAQDAAAVAAAAAGADPAAQKPAVGPKSPKAGKAGAAARNAQADRAKQLPDRVAEDQVPKAAPAAPVADPKVSEAAKKPGVTITELNSEQALKEYDAFTVDPANKDFMALIKQHKLDDDIRAKLQANPGQVRTLSDPGMLDEYVAKLKAGKKDEFMTQFSGEDKSKSLNPADWMSAMSGGIDAAIALDPRLKGLKRLIMSGFGGMMDGIYGIAGALQGSGRSLKDMLNEPTNADELRKAGIVPVNPYDEKYLTTVARDAQENLRARKTAPDGANSVALSRHGMKMLAEDFGVDHKGMQSLLDGSATIAHVDIVEQKNKTTGKMEKVAIARLEPYVPQRPAAAAPGAEPVPSAAAKVEASVAIARAQAHELPTPRPVPSGETTTS